MNSIWNLIDQLELHIQNYNKQMMQLNEVISKTSTKFSTSQTRKNKEKQDFLIKGLERDEMLINELKILMECYNEQRR